jgi:hypothetical protein
MRTGLRWGLLGLAVLAAGLPGAAPAQTPPPAPAVGPPPATPTPLPGVVDMTPDWLRARPAPDGGPACPPAPAPAEPSAVFTSVEYLLLQPRRSDLDFAIADPIARNHAPDGDLEHLSYRFRSGLRVGAGVRLAHSWEAGFFYTYLHSDDDRSLAAPPDGTLYASLTRPGLIDTVDTAAAHAALNYNVFDIQLARKFTLDPTFSLSLLTGTRLASIDQGFSAAYDGGDAHLAEVRTSSRFRGAGLFVGGQGDWAVGHGLSLFGRARGALLFGDIRSRLTETDNAGRTGNANVNDDFRQVVPMVEMATGVAWQYRSLRVSAGYEAANWFNLASRPVFVDDFAEGKYTRRTSDLSLEGLFVQLGLAF